MSRAVLPPGVSPQFDAAPAGSLGPGRGEAPPDTTVLIRVEKAAEVFSGWPDQPPTGGEMTHCSCTDSDPSDIT